jgi:hypothetical protein
MNRDLSWNEIVLLTFLLIIMIVVSEFARDDDRR